jgi:hypothetical protein
MAAQTTCCDLLGLWSWFCCIMHVAPAAAYIVSYMVRLQMNWPLPGACSPVKCALLCPCIGSLAAYLGLEYSPLCWTSLMQPLQQELDSRLSSWRIPPGSAELTCMFQDLQTMLLPSQPSDEPNHAVRHQVGGPPPGNYQHASSWRVAGWPAFTPHLSNEQLIAKDIARVGADLHGHRSQDGCWLT